MKYYIIRLYGVSAHFRDPRFNTGGIKDLPLRTLHSPPPCTIHGLLCAAKGGWIEPETLQVGWRMNYTSVITDFQTCWMPKSNNYSWKFGIQSKESSPREREFLSFPILTLLCVNGIDITWFFRPANPLCLGRSEDLITMKNIESVTLVESKEGIIKNQCLPFGIGYGTIYPSPLYFENNRAPVLMAPKTDARIEQQISSKSLMRVEETQEVFYIWDYKNAVR